MLGKCMSVLQYYELNELVYCTVNHVMSVIMKLFEAKGWPSSMETEKLKPIWWAGSSQAWVPSVWTHEVADVDDAFRNSIRQSALENDTQPPIARGNSRFFCHGDGDGAGGLQQLGQRGHKLITKTLLRPPRRAWTSSLFPTSLLFSSSRTCLNPDEEWDGQWAASRPRERGRRGRKWGVPKLVAWEWRKADWLAVAAAGRRWPWRRRRLEGASLVAAARRDMPFLTW